MHLNLGPSLPCMLSKSTIPYEFLNGMGFSGTGISPNGMGMSLSVTGVSFS